jgi:hypothetical protein
MWSDNAHIARILPSINQISMTPDLEVFRSPGSLNQIYVLVNTKILKFKAWGVGNAGKHILDRYWNSECTNSIHTLPRYRVKRFRDSARQICGYSPIHSVMLDPRPWHRTNRIWNTVISNYSLPSFGLPSRGTPLSAFQPIEISQTAHKCVSVLKNLPWKSCDCLELFFQ